MRIMLIAVVLLTQTYAMVYAAQVTPQSNPAVICLLLMDPSTGVAKEVQMSWERPLLRENNEPLNEADIDYFMLRYRETDAVSNTYNFIIVDSPATSATSTIIMKSGISYEMSISAIDTTGLSSVYSPAVQFSL